MTTPPSLSEVRRWTPDYLESAATQWEWRAQRWSNAFAKLLSELCPDTWNGAGASAARHRLEDDGRTVANAGTHLSAAASAAHTAASELAAARQRVLDAVAAAEAEGFIVSDDYSVRSMAWVLSPAEAVVREALAALHAAVIWAGALELAALDRDMAKSIEAAISGLQALNFDGAAPLFGPPGMPLPEAPPPLPPPPGGWSKDPITEAAQKIVAHAWHKHIAEWPKGTTREQMTAEVERMLRAAPDPKSGLKVGIDVDGSLIIYDPKANIWIYRDLGAYYRGTVFRPSDPKDMLRRRMQKPLKYLSLEKMGFPTPAADDSPTHEERKRPKAESPKGPRGGMPPVGGPRSLEPLPGFPSDGVPPVLDSDGFDDGLPNALLPNSRR